MQTARLVLEPLRIEHAGPMAIVLGDQRLLAFIGGTPDTAAELRDRYTRWLAGPSDPAESWCNWMIRLRESQQLAGTVQATIYPSTDEDAGEYAIEAEIAWMVGIAWQGRGIATEAAMALVGWLSRQPVQTVIAHIRPDHYASAAVATAAGLTPTGEVFDGEIRWQKERGRGGTAEIP